MATADFQKLCIDLARTLQEDLSGLLGVSLRMRGPELATIRAEANGCDEPIVTVPCMAADDAAHGMHLVLRHPDAITLAGLLTALDPGQIEEARKAAPDEAMLKSIGEVLSLAATIVARVGEENSLPGVQPGELRSLDAPAEETDWLPKGGSQRVRWSVEIPEYAAGRIDLLVPEATLASWFGQELAALSANADGDEDGEDEGSTLVVIDACEADRDAIEGMEDALSIGVWAIDPSDLSVAGFEELTDARGLIVDWELGCVTGLEVLHALRCHPTTRRKRIALAAREPTRSLVQIALRHGADSFLAKPYDADEIRARFRITGEGTAATEPATTDDEAEADATEAQGDDATEAQGGDASEAEADDATEAEASAAE